jgi:hypothetical protein
LKMTTHGQIVKILETQPLPGDPRQCLALVAHRCLVE